MRDASPLYVWSSTCAWSDWFTRGVLPTCIYVRDIGASEGRRWQRVVRQDRDRIKVRQAQVILASAQSAKILAIAERLCFSDQHARTIIRDFNAEGFAALTLKYCGGRPPTFREEQCSAIIEHTKCPLDLLGRPFIRWSLEKLREFVIAERVLESTSIETIRQILKAAKVRVRRTKTWKECNDQQLRSKKTDPPLREPAGRERTDDLVRRVLAAGDPAAARPQLGNPAHTAAGDIHPEARRAALAGALRRAFEPAGAAERSCDRHSTWPPSSPVDTTP